MNRPATPEPVFDELRRSRILGRLLGVPITQYDRERRYVWANEAYGRLVGLSPAELAGRRIEDVLGADSYATLAPYVDRVLAGERVEYETEVALPAVGRRFVHAVLEPTRDADGAVDGWMGLVEDVTDRRRYAETRSHLAAIVESSDDAIVGKTLEGIITSWNAGAERLFGYTRDEIVGQPIQRLMPADRVDDMLRILGSIRQGRRVEHYETERIRKDGRRIHVSLTVSPIRDASGRIIGASKIARDVTERRRAENALRETLDLLATLNRTTAAISAELDLEKLVQAVTDAATKVTGARFGAFFYNVEDEGGEAYMLYALSGVARDAFAGFPMPRNTEIFAPTFRGEAIVRLDDVRKDPRYGRNAPYEGVPPGHLPVVSYLAAPVVSRGRVIGGLFFGHPEPGVFTVRDERFVAAFAAQAATAMDNARLYTAERAARADAEAASRAKDDFLSMVSHELRTPLQSMLGWAAVLRQGAQSPERVTRALETIERSGRLQAKLIDDLLDASRIVHGRLVLELQPVGLRAVVEGALDTIGPEAARKDVTIEPTLAEDAVVVGDAVRLQQVVANILSNAVKFTPAGGRAQIEIACEGDAARIVVRDDGVGIDPEFLPHVFDPFRQADDVRKRREGGLGLGLSIVKSLVEQHGGSIAVASEGAGRGTTVTVVLPVAASATSEDEDAAGARSSGTLRHRRA